MRDVLVRAILLFGIAASAAGCQSLGNIGALEAISKDAPPSTPLPTGTPKAAAPAGFISFCLRFGDQCAMPVNTASVILETPAVWQTVNRVNGEINATIAPEDDLDHYGRAEYWTIPADGLGDCDDYALTKRKALIAAGLPANALRVAVVHMWDGERHAVLTLATDKGDYVLDNLNPEVLPWKETDYVWIERQAADNPWNWVALQSDGNAPRMAAAQNQEMQAPVAATDPQMEPKFQEQVAALKMPQHVFQTAPAAPVTAGP